MSQRSASAMLLSMSCAIALAMFSGSTAVASCGDWLAHGAGVAHPSRPVAHVALRVVSQVDPRLTSDVGRPERVPCHGPNCRRAPEPTTPPVPSDRTFSSEKTLPVTSLAQSDPTDRIASARYESRVHPQSGHSHRLDHPPRVL